MKHLQLPHQKNSRSTERLESSTIQVSFEYVMDISQIDATLRAAIRLRHGDAADRRGAPKNLLQSK
jgi:hypothetical protein